MAMINVLKKEIEAAAKRLDILDRVDIENGAEAITAAFRKMLSGPFPTIGRAGLRLREALLSQFYNVGLGELIARFVVAAANVQLTKLSEESFDNLVEARDYLFMAIQMKMRKMRIFDVDEDDLWDVLINVSGRITTILPETAVLIG